MRLVRTKYQVYPLYADTESALSNFELATKQIPANLIECHSVFVLHPASSAVRQTRDATG